MRNKNSDINFSLTQKNIPKFDNQDFQKLFNRIKAIKIPLKVIKTY